ncbi:MAG TPA: ATP-binding protein [Bacteroidales bacterium]|nr:ATP-binding protein [Bacteroidales bacterium]
MNRINRLILLSLVIMASSNAQLFAAHGSYMPESTALQTLPAHITYLILTICVASVVVVSVSVMYVIKRREMNKILQLKTGEIEEANRNLEKLNHELEKQRDSMARNLANSERLYGMMLSSAEDAIAFYKMDWSIQFANKAFYNLIGHSEEDYKNLDPDERDITLLHPDDIGYSEKRSRAISETGFYETEIRIRHTDGRYAFLSSKSVLIKDEEGNPLGILLISRDITSEKKARQELVIAKEKAEESSRLKSTFLANISHEIRTPLNSIVGFANLLNDPGTTDEVREEYTGYLNQNTDRLLQIISDIIDLSRLENDEIEINYNPCRINSILDEKAQYAEQLISRSGKKIEFTLSKEIQDGKDVIYTDAVWLKRVFRHLIDNAVKFTREGSISFTSAIAGTSLMFTIKDTGIGISKDHLKSIFEQFRQEVAGYHRPFEGLGVGLTLAKHVIKQMDGYLWVESEKGEGSEFFVTIPYRPVDVGSVSKVELHTEEVEPAAEKKHDWGGKKVLITDDNNDILSYLTRILTDTGVTVILARSGEEALKIVKETDDIDLVLLDMQMAEMNGLEATREIRKLKENLPIIAQTAFIFEEEKNMILNAGCDACIIKPVRQDQLYSVVSGFLGTN